MKEIKDISEHLKTEHYKTISALLTVDAELYRKDPKGTIKEKRQQMEEAVKVLDFETAAIIRDEIRALEALKPRRK
jgi:protein-arginine kinase activator protein McsA